MRVCVFYYITPYNCRDVVVRLLGVRLWFYVYSKVGRVSVPSYMSTHTVCGLLYIYIYKIVIYCLF